MKNYLKKFNGLSVTLVGPFFADEEGLVEPIIYVDRGSNFRKGQRGWSVGDGDSSEGPLDELLNPDKDFSDLAYVLRNIPESFQEIHLLGFLGGRKDHELINLAEVHTFLKTRPVQTVVLFDQQIAAYGEGIWRLEIQGTFSVFTFESAELSLGGACQYQISSSVGLKALSSNGLSNVGFGAIDLQTQRPVFIFTEPPAFLKN